MIIALTIYLISVIVFWLLNHFYAEESEPADIIVWLLPVINTFTILMILIGILCININWQKVTDFIFQTKSEE